jgi:uncharacterized membrane protein YqaE (UPF0057 family)
MYCVITSVSNQQYIMTTTQNPSKPLETMRLASTPFTIYMEDQPYILTAEALKRQVDARLTRKKDWFFPKIRVHSFDNSVLHLQISSKGESYKMEVGLEPDKLRISCSCGTSIETLCLHTYKTLERLTWYRSSAYFIKYRPNGIVEVASQNLKYFDKIVNEEGVDYAPKTNLGSVYKIADMMKSLNFSDVLSLPLSTNTHRSKPKDTALAYLLMDSYGNKYLPFLLPCVGVLNKAGVGLKAFNDFIISTNAPGQNLTEDQGALNRSCYEMWTTAKAQPNSLLAAHAEVDYLPAIIFAMWEKAIPMLQHQQFIYRYTFYGKRERRSKPSKSRLERINLLPDVPRLHFLLIDKGAFYQLQMKITIEGRNINQYDSQTTFFINNDNNFYLLSSLKDAGIVQWMKQSGGFITVFKEHFEVFEQEYLNPLRKSYQVKTIQTHR